MSEQARGSSQKSVVDEVETVEILESDETVEAIPKIELEPIRTVVRELTRPDGSTVTVEVPVYPPFEMKDIPSGASSKPATNGKRARSK